MEKTSDHEPPNFLQEPFSFSPYHKAIREPFDYYMFGQNYIRPLVDFRCYNILVCLYFGISFLNSCEDK